MEGNKNFNYTITPTPEEVSLLVCEFTELFLNNKGLANALPTVLKLSNKLAQLKAKQDYNAEATSKYRQTVRVAISEAIPAEIIGENSETPEISEITPAIEDKKPKAPKKPKSKSEVRRLEIMKLDETSS